MNAKPTPASDPEALQAQVDEWERSEVASFLAKQAEKSDRFFTHGGLPLKRTFSTPKSPSLMGPEIIDEPQVEPEKPAKQADDSQEG